MDINFWIDPINFIINWLRNLLTGWGLSSELIQVLMDVFGAFVLATGAMLFVIFLIWLERKVIGRVQDRLGPNRIGPWGIFQPIADMLKIFTKEHITPDGVDKVPYNIAPVLSVAAVLAIYAVLPFAVTLYGVDLNVGLLYIVAVGGLGELAIMLAGWSSNNKFAMLGAFRSVAQLISYEVPLVLSLLIPVFLSGSMGLNDIVKAQNVWFIFLAPLPAIVFLLASIAEVGRSPFDLLEAESELVSGFNVEYSGLKFGMFYVADFLHAFTISLVFATIFLGGWRGPWAEQYPLLGVVYYLMKTSVVYFFTLLLRASLPRFRIDQMMDLNWKVFTPLMLVMLMVTALAVKVLPDQAWIKIPVLLVINGIIYLGMDWLIKKNQERKPRRVVVKV